MTSFNSTFYTLYPYMNIFEYYLYSFGLLICPIVFMLCIIFTGLIIKLEWNRFHSNFCILHMNLIIGFFCICIFHFLLCLVCLIEGLIYPKENYILSFIAVVGCNFGATLLRCLWVAIFIERTIATIYRDFYEKRTNIFISIGLLFSCYIVSGIIEFSRWALSVDLNYTQSFALIFDIVAILSLSYLSKYNRKLRRINARSDIKLTQRYQLAENVRALKIIVPILRIGVVFTITGTILIWISFKIEMFLWAFRYTIMIYYTMFNIFIFIAFTLWVKNDVTYRALIFKVLKKTNLTTSNAIRPALVNVEGRAIPENQSPDLYFATLKLMWNTR